MEHRSPRPQANSGDGCLKPTGQAQRRPRSAFALAAALLFGLASHDAWAAIQTTAVLKASPKLPPHSAMDAALLDQAVAAADKDLPALQSLVILRDGVLVREAYLHGGSADRAFNVKSASKSILSVLCGIALADGKLQSVDQTVAELLPALHADTPPAADRMFADGVLERDRIRRQVRVRHLLTMTTGRAWEENGGLTYAWAVAEDPVRLTLDLPFVAEPGSRFLYSTAETHVLAAILQQQTGDLQAWAEERLFRPAGMSLARWDRDGQGCPVGGSEMYFTARDMAKFGQLVLDNGRAGGRQVVPAEWLEASLAKQVDVPDKEYADMMPGFAGYGYLWWRRQTAAGMSWSAEGYGGQFVTIVPELRLVVAGGSALDDEHGADTIKQFQGIYRILDSFILPAAITARGSAPKRRPAP